LHAARANRVKMKVLNYSNEITTCKTGAQRVWPTDHIWNLLGYLPCEVVKKTWKIQHAW